jgi:hypothetical protein
VNEPGIAAERVKRESPEAEVVEPGALKNEGSVGAIRPLVHIVEHEEPSNPAQAENVLEHGLPEGHPTQVV